MQRKFRTIYNVDFAFGLFHCDKWLYASEFSYQIDWDYVINKNILFNVDLYRFFQGNVKSMRKSKQTNYSHGFYENVCKINSKNALIVLFMHYIDYIKSWFTANYLLLFALHF